MKKGSRIFVAGADGLLGSALIRRLGQRGYSLTAPRRSELDLTDEYSVRSFFRNSRPEFVFLSAAKVGGISENIRYPVNFLEENIRIQQNVLKAAHQFDVKRLLFFSSNCCYPRECLQPMKEEYMMTGPLEPTNEAYAVAKIAGIKLCQSYNQQYETEFYCAILASLYGPGDHFGEPRSHVVADMISKFNRAKESNSPRVTLNGDGSPLREFLFVDDAADAAVFLMDHASSDLVNVGTGEEISIFELAKVVARAVGYKGEVIWNTSFPNGMPRKLLDSSRCHRLGWRHKTNLEEGIGLTCKWYFRNLKYLP